MPDFYNECESSDEVTSGGADAANNGAERRNIETMDDKNESVAKNCSNGDINLSAMDKEDPKKPIEAKESTAAEAATDIVTAQGEKDGRSSKKQTHKASPGGTIDEAEPRVKKIYDQDGYQQLVCRAKKSKEMQDFVERAFAEKAKLDLAYSSSVKSWIRNIEEQLVKLQPFQFDFQLINTILLREKRMCESREKSSKCLSSIGKSYRRKTESLYGDSALGGLDNVNNIGNKLKMAQKHWFKILKEFQEARRAYLDQCIMHEKISEKLQLAVQKKNSSDTEHSTNRLHERLEQSRVEKQALRERYNSLFEEVVREKEQYIGDVHEVFQYYLNIEKSRFLFNRQQTKNYFDIGLEYSKAVHDPQLTDNAFAFIDKIDPKADLKHLSELSGPNSLLKIPVKEDIESRVSLLASPGTASCSPTEGTETQSAIGANYSRKIGTLKRQVSEEMGKQFETMDIVPNVELDFELTHSITNQKGAKNDEAHDEDHHRESKDLDHDEEVQ